MGITEQSVMGVIRSARPTFRNAHDKVAFAVHASFLASGFVLHATGPPAFADDALYSSSTDEVGIENWDAFEDNYGFVYSNPDKGSKKILVKCLAMNDILIVDALRNGDSEPTHLEINVKDYVVEDGANNYASMFKDLGKLVAAVEKEILSKYVSSSAASSSSQNQSSENRKPRERESELENPSTSDPPPSWLIYPPVPGVGGDDLFPGPGAGMYPPRGDFGGPGGMVIGPNHPMFGRVGREPRMPGGLPGSVPPGARFDPYGPPGVPGFEPNRFIRDPRRPGGRGNHPDLEHFRDDTDFI